MSFNKKEYSKQNIPCDELEITYIPIQKAVLTGFFSTMEADGHRNFFFFFRNFMKNFHLHQLGYMDVTRSLARGKRISRFLSFWGLPGLMAILSLSVSVCLCLGECECDSRSCLTSYLTSCFFVKFCGYGCFCVFRWRVFFFTTFGYRTMASKHYLSLVGVGGIELELLVRTEAEQT